jgi:16S rRNA (cytidine1402-2'-O)-methyltransferase
VATPIGNLRDITLRALDVLASVSLIAAEDTRVTQKLMTAYSLKTPLVSFHAHNTASEVPKVLARLAAGESVALVSDAGTPLLSDPGAELVAAAVAAGYRVEAVPGASALLTALTASALPAGQFFFAGFLPPKKGARREAIAALAGVPGTIVFYESPQRLPETLLDLAELLPGRQGVVARELTKVYEEYRRGSLSDLAAQYSDPPKGEVVLLVAPPSKNTEVHDFRELLRVEMKTRTLRDAVAVVTARTGMARREIYAAAVALERDFK